MLYKAVHVLFIILQQGWYILGIYTVPLSRPAISKTFNCGLQSENLPEKFNGCTGQIAIHNEGPLKRHDKNAATGYANTLDI